MAGKRLLVYNAQEQHKAWLAGNAIYGMYGDYPPALGLEGIREMLEPKRARLADRHRKINRDAVLGVVVSILGFLLVAGFICVFVWACIAVWNHEEKKKAQEQVSAPAQQECDNLCQMTQDVPPGGCVAMNVRYDLWTEVCRGPFNGRGLSPPSQTDAPG